MAWIHGITCLCQRRRLDEPWNDFRKKFLFGTTDGEEVCQSMLPDQLLPMLEPKQFIEMKCFGHDLKCKSNCNLSKFN